MKHRVISTGLFWPALAAVLLALYWPCLTLPPAGDDWMWIGTARELVKERGTPGALVGVFSSPVSVFYRPVALIPFILSPDELVVGQFLKLLLLVWFAWLIYRAGRGIGLSNGWSTLVGSVVPMHQVFAAVSTEYDFWGDLTAAIMFVLLIDLCQRFHNGAIGSARYHWLSLVYAAICLLSKEAGVTCFTIPILFAVIRPVTATARVRNQLWLGAGLIFLLTLVYLAVRATLSIPSTSDDAYYAFSFGPNILTNCALAAAALLSPVNTVFVALESLRWKLLAGGFVLILLSLFVTGAAIALRSNRWRWPLLLTMITGLAQGPVFLMPHLTEANFTRSLAPGWFACAYCFALVFERYPSRQMVIGFVLLMVGWFAFDLSADYEKCREIASDQHRFESFRNELRASFSDTEADSLLVAVVDPGITGYSVYRQPFMNDLQKGEIQYSVPALFHPRRVSPRVTVVASIDEAREQGADCLVKEDGHVVRLGLR